MLGSVMTHSINVAPIYLQNWTLSESMNILQVSLSLSLSLIYTILSTSSDVDDDDGGS